MKLTMAFSMVLCSFQALAANKDYYEILGVARSASDDDIKKAYRKLIRGWHPDVNSQVSAEKAHQKTTEINEAWDVLGDPKKRAAYDGAGFVPPPRTKSKLEEVVAIVARYRSDTREWRARKDLEFLAQFKTDEQIEALRAVIEVRKGNIFQDYNDLLKFDDPKLVDRLKVALKSGARHFSFDAFFRDELFKATQVIASKVSFRDAGALIEDLARVQPRSNIERQALGEFIKQNQAQIFKLAPHEAQLRELEKMSGLSNLSPAYQKFRTEIGSQLDYDAMYKRLESERDRIRDRKALDEITAQAVSPAQRKALSRFMILNPSWMAQIDQSGDELRKLLEEKGYGEEFRREVAEQYLRHVRSLNDYFSLTGLSGPPGRRPWRNLIAASVGDFLRLKPELADIQRVLKVKGLGASGVTLAAAAIDQATTPSELRSLELPAGYTDSLEIKNRYRSKMSSFGKSESPKCFTTVTDVLRSLVKRGSSSHNE